HLRQLQLRVTKPTSKVDNISCSIEYPDNFYQFLRGTCIGTRKKDDKTCERTIELFLTQSSDLDSSLRDPFWKPSFEWEHGILEDLGNKLILYHNNDYDVDKITIEYLRKPKHIATPSLTDNKYYIDAEGN